MAETRAMFKHNLLLFWTAPRPFWIWDNRVDTRSNFKLMLANLNIYYLNKAAIFKYGGYSDNFKT